MGNSYLLFAEMPTPSFHPLVDGAFDLEFSMQRMQQHPRATESTFSLVATLLAPISKEKSSDRICRADI